MIKTLFKSPSFILSALIGSVLTGCSQSTEDVRIGMCRQVTERLLESMTPIEWKSVQAQPRQQGDAEVKLGFGITKEGYEGRTITASCFYEHDMNEESALEHVNPLAAFATIPYAMEIQDKPVPEDIVRQAVTSEQLEPIKDFIKRLEQEFETLKSTQF
jgi:hypothetical protein